MELVLIGIGVVIGGLAGLSAGVILALWAIRD